jgi:Mrp family chromosome partitioning ATPase
LEESVPAILVVGGCSGSGATTTAVGLAAAIATTTEYDSVAVDATASGGDLAARGADELLRPVSMQSWLAGN